jgi:uncharacterized protein YfdQ (DUF2303 family)
MDRIDSVSLFAPIDDIVMDEQKNMDQFDTDRSFDNSFQVFSSGCQITIKHQCRTDPLALGQRHFLDIAERFRHHFVPFLGILDYPIKIRLDFLIDLFFEFLKLFHNLSTKTNHALEKCACRMIDDEFDHF